MNQIVLRSEGADVPYNLRFGHFDVADEKLDIVLELEIADSDNEDSPPEILIRLANLEFRAQPSALHVRDHHDDWGADDGRPHAYVYSGFHHSDVSAWIVVRSHDLAQLTAEIKVVTDDVDRYDESATDNTMAGQCVLTRQAKSEMWSP